MREREFRFEIEMWDENGQPSGRATLDWPFSHLEKLVTVKMLDDDGELVASSRMHFRSDRKQRQS